MKQEDVQALLMLAAQRMEGYVVNIERPNEKSSFDKQGPGEVLLTNIHRVRGSVRPNPQGPEEKFNNLIQLLDTTERKGIKDKLKSVINEIREFKEYKDLANELPKDEPEKHGLKK